MLRRILPFFYMLTFIAGAGQAFAQNMTPRPPAHYTPMPPRHQAAEAPETRFGHWGYRHKELHDAGLIEQLHALTNSKCCDGPLSGECRLSAVNMPKRLVYIDGGWCPISQDTKVVVLDLGDIANTEGQSLAVVCAGRKYREICPASYCIGLDGLKM